MTGRCYKAACERAFCREGVFGEAIGRGKEEGKSGGQQQPNCLWQQDKQTDPCRKSHCSIQVEEAKLSNIKSWLIANQPPQLIATAGV